MVFLTQPIDVICAHRVLPAHNPCYKNDASSKAAAAKAWIIDFWIFFSHRAEVPNEIWSLKN